MYHTDFQPVSARHYPVMDLEATTNLYLVSQFTQYGAFFTFASFTCFHGTLQSAGITSPFFFLDVLILNSLEQLHSLKKFRGVNMFSLGGWGGGLKNSCH